MSGSISSGSSVSHSANIESWQTWHIPLMEYSFSDKSSLNSIASLSQVMQRLLAIWISLDLPVSREMNKSIAGAFDVGSLMLLFSDVIVMGTLLKNMNLLLP